MISLREEETVGLLSLGPATLNMHTSLILCAFWEHMLQSKEHSSLVFSFLFFTLCGRIRDSSCGLKKKSPFFLAFSFFLLLFFASFSSFYLHLTPSIKHAHTHTHRGHRELQVSIHASHYRGMSVFYEAV